MEVKDTLNKIVGAAIQEEGGIVSVAAAHDPDVIHAVVTARRCGIVTPILVGHTQRIQQLLYTEDENPAEYEIIEADSDVDCARAAVALVTEGKADFLMKGILGTADLMRCVLAKEANLRTDRLLSHIMLFETSGYHKMLMVTDGGLNTFPDFGKKVQILDNAASVLQCLGYEHINASCVCGAEVVNPKVQSTVDAADIAAMPHWKTDYNMDVIGPVSVDLALSREACTHKSFNKPGAGDADVVLVPNYEMGNALYKTALCMTCGCRAAGVVIGARAPVILASRSDSAQSKLCSLSLGLLISRCGQRAE